MAEPLIAVPVVRRVATRHTPRMTLPGGLREKRAQRAAIRHYLVRADELAELALRLRAAGVPKLAKKAEALAFACFLAAKSEGREP